MQRVVSRTAARLKRVAFATAVVVAILLTAGLCFQAIDSRLTFRRLPPPGQMVALDGFSLHVQSMGQGGPTVVFEAGLGGWSLDWARVAPVVAKSSCVVVYDRAGTGWSDRGPQPRTSERVIAELHALLAAAGIPGPYVLVGHSLGGLYAQTFAAAYPDDVVGLVLVDATVAAPLTPELRANLSAPDILVLERAISRQWAAGATVPRTLAVTAPFGLPRLLTLSHLVEACPPGMPDELKSTYAALKAQPKALLTNWREVAAVQTAPKVTPDLGDLPVVILRPASQSGVALPAGLSAQGQAYLQSATLREPLLALSRNSRLVTVADSGHDIQLDQPTAVIDAIAGLCAAGGRRRSASGQEVPSRAKNVPSGLQRRQERAVAPTDPCLSTPLTMVE